MDCQHAKSLSLRSQKLFNRSVNLINWLLWSRSTSWQSWPVPNLFFTSYQFVHTVSIRYIHIDCYSNDVRCYEINAKRISSTITVWKWAKQHNVGEITEYCLSQRNSNYYSAYWFGFFNDSLCIFEEVWIKLFLICKQDLLYSHSYLTVHIYCFAALAISPKPIILFFVGKYQLPYYYEPIFN